MKNLLQIKYLRLIIHQCQHNNAKAFLQLSMLIKLIQYNIWINISSKLNYNAHTITV